MKKKPEKNKKHFTKWDERRDSDLFWLWIRSELIFYCKLLFGFAVIIFFLWVSDPIISFSEKNLLKSEIWKNLLPNLYTTAIGTITTIAVVSSFSKRTGDKRELERLKRQLGSTVNSTARRAAEELRYAGISSSCGIRRVNWLEDGSLRGADLYEANLQEANLRGADLRHANLMKARLVGANLSKADLRDADLRKADLRGAVLCWADLRDAQIDENTLLQYADLRGACITPLKVEKLKQNPFGMHSSEPFEFILPNGERFMSTLSTKEKDAKDELSRVLGLVNEHNLDHKRKGFLQYYRYKILGLTRVAQTKKGIGFSEIEYNAEHKSKYKSHLFQTWFNSSEKVQEERGKLIEFSDGTPPYILQCHKAHFYRLNLQGAILCGLNFKGAKLIHANLKGVCICGANFTDADLHWANLENVKYGSNTVFSPKTILPDCSNYNVESDVERFVNKEHEHFWRATGKNNMTSPAYPWWGRRLWRYLHSKSNE